MAQPPIFLEACDTSFQLPSFANARQQDETGAQVIEKGEGSCAEDINGQHQLEGLTGFWSVDVTFAGVTFCF